MTARLNLSNPFRRTNTEPTRFVIVCQPRTGSSLLNTSLRQHPEIHMDREILNHQQPHALPDEGAERLRACLSRTTHRAVGCNLHAFQPDRSWEGWPKWESAWQALAEDRLIKVIHLQRLDLLAQLASWKIAKFTGLWGPQQRLQARPRVYVEPDELKWFHEWNRTVFGWRLSHLKAHSILHVTYESLCDSWDATIAECQRFLNVPVQKLPPMAIKGETRHLSDVISNWTDVAESAYRDMTCQH